jgi:(2Fe-2S) ferredoxin
VIDGDIAPRYVIVCRGPNCRENGGVALLRRLVDLLRNKPGPRLAGYSCFGQCDFGPNVAVFPDGVFFGGLRDGEAAERVMRHVMGDPTVAVAPLSMPADERAEHLKNIAELVATLERDRGRARRWWWPF